jgi:hypothetical protein
VPDADFLLLLSDCSGEDEKEAQRCIEPRTRRCDACVGLAVPEWVEHRADPAKARAMYAKPADAQHAMVQYSLARMLGNDKGGPIERSTRAARRGESAPLAAARR